MTILWLSRVKVDLFEFIVTISRVLRHKSLVYLYVCVPVCVNLSKQTTPQG